MLGMNARPGGGERRWTGPFRMCPACGQRNFYGRAACTACGANLRSLAPEAPSEPAPLTGRRGSDRIRDRRVVSTLALVAVAATGTGLLLYRSLRSPVWAPLPGTVTDMVARPSAAATPDAGPTELPAAPRPEDRAAYEKGRRLLADGDAKRALGPLGDAARALPRDPVVAHDYGLALVKSGDVDRGLFQLERASRLAPGIGSYRMDLIRALLGAGRRGAAAREAEQVLARDPTNQEAAQLLASLTGAAPAGGATDTAPTIDMGGAAASTTRPAPGASGGSFTNEDLERRRGGPAIAPSLRPSAAPSPSL
jgi:hypothetical protein